MAPEFFRLAAREICRNQRHAQQLLLRQRNTKRAPQNAFKRRMHAHLRFFPLPPENVGMHHAAHDGAGPDDSHLHDDIVKRFRPGARKDACCARLSTWNMPIVSAR